jgi:hypothetical protein
LGQQCYMFYPPVKMSPVIEWGSSVHIVIVKILIRAEAAQRGYGLVVMTVRCGRTSLRSIRGILNV